MTSLTSYQLLQSKSKKNKLSCEECEEAMTMDIYIVLNSIKKIMII